MVAGLWFRVLGFGLGVLRFFDPRSSILYPRLFLALPSSLSLPLSVEPDLNRADDDFCQVAPFDDLSAFVAPVGDFKLRGADDFTATPVGLHFEAIAGGV
jgi:hypothetical protein